MSIFNVIIAEHDESGNVVNVPYAWRLKDAETVETVRMVLDLYNELGNLLDAMDQVRALDLPRQGPRPL